MTAEGTILDGQTEYCNIPTTEGSVGIMANHAPMICAVREGTGLFRMENGEEKILNLSAGAADIRNNAVMILVERAEKTERK